jgi:hypothetical protein
VLYRRRIQDSQTGIMSLICRALPSSVRAAHRQVLFWQSRAPVIVRSHQTEPASVVAASYGEAARQAALHVLGQKRAVLRSVSESQYSQPLPAFVDASIAAHMRHSLAHFRALLDIIHAPRAQPHLVQYDVRDRQNPSLADTEHIINDLTSKIELLDVHGSAPIVVEFMSFPPTLSAYRIQSSALRELAFVTHHAIHHLATIRLMMTTMGICVEGNTLSQVGRAPSTLHNDSTGGIEPGAQASR